MSHKILKILILLNYCFLFESGLLDLLDQKNIKTTQGDSSKKGLLEELDTNIIKPILKDSPTKVDQDEFPRDWNITFNLFTPKDPNKQIILNFTADDEEIKNSDFNPKLRTKFLIHGWMSSYYSTSFVKTQWQKETKDSILGQIKANVICVDWSTPASDINYLGAIPNVPIVGRMVAHFINRLIRLMGASTNDMHCIGHSLGSHVCGYTGGSLPHNKLAQITGLDPAWPGFDRNSALKTFADIYYPPLNISNANLVLAIHTSAGFETSGDFSMVGFLGNPNVLGHYDFWVNGGNKQPMCEGMRQDWGVLESVADLITLKFSNALSTLFETLVCPHMTAVMYSIAKPENDCQMIAYKCNNYEDFKGGKCADQGMPLDYRFNYYENLTKKLNQTIPPNNLYIITSDKNPFCLFHYQIVIRTNQSNMNETQINLYGSKNINIAVQFWPKNELNIYYYLHTDEEELGVVSKATYDNPEVKIEAIYINYMSHIEKRPIINMEKQKVEGNSLSDWLSSFVG